MPLTGCAAWHRASADREVNKVLAMRQVQTTGLPFPASFPADDSVAAGPEAYEFSPTVSQADGPSLFGPIDEAVPRWAAGEGGAAEFDLAGALAYALGHSREFQFQLEELYLATLDLTLERHLWSPRWIQEVRSRLDGAGKRGEGDGQEADQDAGGCLVPSPGTPYQRPTWRFRIVAGAPFSLRRHTRA